jgi:uncharacterized membrane protein YkoI
MKRAALLLACALLAGAAPSWADVSRDDAAARAAQAGGGRVLSVEKSDSGGRVVWRVKLVTTQGEVKVVLVDAATGRVL